MYFDEMVYGTVRELNLDPRNGSDSNCGSTDLRRTNIVEDIICNKFAYDETGDDRMAAAIKDDWLYGDKVDNLVLKGAGHPGDKASDRGGTHGSGSAFTVDHIFSFNQGDDVIDLASLGADSFADLTIAYDDAKGSATVSSGLGKVVLQNFNGVLTAADFL